MRTEKTAVDDEVWWLETIEQGAIDDLKSSPTDIPDAVRKGIRYGFTRFQTRNLDDKRVQQRQLERRIEYLENSSDYLLKQMPPDARSIW